MTDLLAPLIYTPNGFANTNPFPHLRSLDVGCSGRKLKGAVGMDIVQSSEVDVVHDIEQKPWPFKEGEFDVVFMNHSLEHVDDVLSVLGEAHRILKGGGRLIVQVPHFRATDAFVDPTHRHFFTSRSLDYFCAGEKIAEDYRYVPFRFRKLGFWYGWPHRSRNPLRQIVKWFMHRYPDFYDQYLSLLLPVECITWELESVK